MRHQMNIYKFLRNKNTNTNKSKAFTIIQITIYFG